MNQLKSGALLSYINIILNIGIGLVLTPFIIRSFGNSEYGLYTLIGSFVAYLSLMDLGLSYTIIRFVAKYRAEKDPEGERKFLGTTMLIYFAISAVLVIIGLVLYFNLDKIFSQSLTPEQLGEAKIMFLILVFNIAITLPGNSFTGICNAYEHFVFPRSLSIIRYIIRSLVVVAVLKFGGKAISLVIIDTVFNLIVISFTSYYSFTRLNIQFSFREREWKVVKQIFSYSMWIFIIALVQSFQWNAGQVVLGINTNTTSVAVYAVGIMLGSYYGTFASAINGLLLPRATQMLTANKGGIELTQTMIKVGRLNNFLSLFILSGFFLFGKEFIHLWIGDSYKDSWLIAFLIMIVLTIPLTQSFGNSILEAKNKVAYKAILNLLTMFTGVIAGFFLSKIYGLIGMIIPIVLALFINTIITNFYFIKVFQFKVILFFKDSFFSQLVAIGILCFIFFQLKKLIEIDNWLRLLICIIIFSVIYIPFYYFLLLDKSEKEIIKNLL
jgi:O-antigen/teichoic acid export membrane protein